MEGGAVGHNFERDPPRDHPCPVWFNLVQRFQRRRFKCEKLTDGRTLTHDKSSHGLWPGELKKESMINKMNCELMLTYAYMYYISIFSV
jgi:hypothetical protein